MFLRYSFTGCRRCLERDTYIVINVRIIAVVEQSTLVNLLSLLGTIKFDENIAAIYVSLSVIGSHAYRLSVQQISLLESRRVLSYKIRKIDEYVQMIRCDACLIRLARFSFREQRFRLRNK